MIAEYLFSVPEGGRYQPWLIVTAVVATVLWLATVPVARRHGFAAVRRRARRLGRIMLTIALIIAVSLLARMGEVPVVSWRLWLLLGLSAAGVALVGWLLGLRDLTHDQVEERRRQREQFYRKPRRSGRRKGKRRRR